MCLLVMATAIMVTLSDLAFAQALMVNDTPMGNVMCTVFTWFLGNVGKGLAVIAVTIIGVGAMLGKVSWGMAQTVGIGVALLFGANKIVGLMGADVIGFCWTGNAGTSAPF